MGAIIYIATYILVYRPAHLGKIHNVGSKEIIIINDTSSADKVISAFFIPVLAFENAVLIRGVAIVDTDYMDGNSSRTYFWWDRNAKGAKKYNHYQ